MRGWGRARRRGTLRQLPGVGGKALLPPAAGESGVARQGWGTGEGQAFQGGSEAREQLDQGQECPRRPLWPRVATPA